MTGVQTCALPIYPSADGILAIFDGPTRAIRCGREIVRHASSLGFEVKVGIHTGEVERSARSVTGVAVRTGRQVADLAEPGEVLLSRTVRDLVAGSGLTFTDRGLHELGGVSGSWRLFAADD